jgi:hypothetical protein
MSKVSNREVDHENDGFVFLADEAAQNPQGYTVGQKTGDEYEDIGGCVEGILKRHLKISALCSCTVCAVTSHLVHLCSFLRKSIRVMISAKNIVKIVKGMSIYV